MSEACVTILVELIARSAILAMHLAMHSRQLSDVAFLGVWSLLSLAGAVSAFVLIKESTTAIENILLEQLLHSEVPISVPANPDTVNLFGVRLSTSNVSLSST